MINSFWFLDIRLPDYGFKIRSMTSILKIGIRGQKVIPCKNHLMALKPMLPDDRSFDYCK